MNYHKSGLTKQEILDSLDEFTVQFLETALWSSTYQVQGEWEEVDVPLDNDYEIHNFTKDALIVLATTCQDFQEDNELLLEKAYEETGNNESQAGHDFWLTKEGHGAGFWDGDWGEYGTALTNASKPYGSDYIYVWQGKLYI